MLQYIPARLLTFPLAVILGFVGYNIEKIVMPPKKVTANTPHEEKGITQQREERLLSNNETNNLDIFTRRQNLFDKNDAKYLK